MLTQQQLQDLSKKTSFTQQELKEYIGYCENPTLAIQDKWVLAELNDIINSKEAFPRKVTYGLIEVIINHYLANDPIIINNIFAIHMSIQEQLTARCLLKLAGYSNVEIMEVIKIAQHSKVNSGILETLIVSCSKNSPESDDAILESAKKVGLSEEGLFSIVRRAKKVETLLKVLACHNSVTDMVINSIVNTRFYTANKECFDLIIAGLKNQSQTEAEAQRLKDIAAKEEALRRQQRQAEEENQRLRRDIEAHKHEETLRRRKAEEEERARQNQEAQRAAAREEELRRQRQEAQRAAAREEELRRQHQEAQRAAAEREEALRRQRQALDAELRAANDARRAAENARAQYGNRGVMFGQGRNVVNNDDNPTHADLKKLASTDLGVRKTIIKLGFRD